MTADTEASELSLDARLRKVESSREWSGADVTTSWYRNPDGPEAADRITQLEQQLSDAKTMLTVTAEAAATHLNRVSVLEHVAKRARKWLPHVEGCQIGGEVDLLCDDIDTLLEPPTQPNAPVKPCDVCGGLEYHRRGCPLIGDSMPDPALPPFTP